MFEGQDKPPCFEVGLCRFGGTPKRGAGCPFPSIRDYYSCIGDGQPVTSPRKNMS